MEKIYFKKIEKKGRNLQQYEIDALVELLVEYSSELRYPLPPNPKETYYQRLQNLDDDKFNESQIYSAWNDTQSLGFASISRSLQDNLHFANLQIYVSMNYRGKGLAKQLLNQCIQNCHPAIRIININIRNDENKNGKTPTGSLHEKLVSIGGQFTISTRKSGSRIKTFNKEEVTVETQKLRKKANINDYDVIFVENGKFETHPVIQHQYNNYVSMIEQIWNDVPIDDASWEPEILTIDQHRDFYTKLLEYDETFWTFIAIHKESGVPVGFTETMISGLGPTIAIQEDTGVVKEHRGKNLGLTLKYHMLEKLLTHPKSKFVEWWITENAYSNQHMLRINHILKYEELSTTNTYEIRIEDLKAYLNKFYD